MIKRDQYLQKLVSFMWNGQVKVITGLRRCGKSYLLKTIFANYLRQERGVKPSDILVLNLDEPAFARYCNPIELSNYVKHWAAASQSQRYLFIDEIQYAEPVANPYLPDGRKITFYDALNSFMHIDNLDVYVTGYNSKMLSSDVLTEFRGRGDEIRLHPVSFAEYHAAVGGDKRDRLEDYLRYGGMPLGILRKTEEEREEYLRTLFDETYFKDIVERKKVGRIDVLNHVTDFLASAIGSLTNPNNIANVLVSSHGYDISVNTVSAYVGYLTDAFLFSEVRRYDVKGRSFFDYPNKYYCEDVGLRNARLNFRQQEPTHLMENVIYNELRVRGFQVDVGVVHSWERNERGNARKVAREIDFVVNKRGERVYVQSAFVLPDNAKRECELKPFSLTGDSFRKIIVRNDIGRRWFDENGILNISLVDFLLDPSVV